MIDLNRSRNLKVRPCGCCFRLPLLLPVLIASLGSMMLAGRVTAQTFTTLHSFQVSRPNSLGVNTNSEGAFPYAGLILWGSTLYGTAYYGGSSGNGTVFAVNTDGSGFTTLHTFTATPASFPYTNSDGANPNAGLILSGNTLYGTALRGSTGSGTVFAVNTNGTGFTNTHSFTGGGDGASPYDGLILLGNTLYGTAYGGGSSGLGTVFAVNTTGAGFKNVHSFTGGDGGVPYAGLILSGNTLYGTASESVHNGTVFAVSTNGTGFRTLHDFTATPASFPYTNSDGAYPVGGLILLGSTLYGTAFNFGGAGNGTVFAVNTDGTGFKVLHSFTAANSGKNGDGAAPWAGLILLGNTLYGTARGGGSAGNGTVFAINTDGTGFTNLHSFTAGRVNSSGNVVNSDGAVPYAGLILSGNTLYGTASEGGSSGNGTVFSILIPPQLTIVSSAANVILTWPTNFSGYTLQSTTNLLSAAWTTNSPAPVVVNGQNTVTNPISGTQQFYRLSQ